MSREAAPQQGNHSLVTSTVFLRSVSSGFFTLDAAKFGDRHFVVGPVLCMVGCPQQPWPLPTGCQWQPPHTAVNPQSVSRHARCPQRWRDGLCWRNPDLANALDLQRGEVIRGRSRSVREQTQPEARGLTPTQPRALPRAPPAACLGPQPQGPVSRWLGGSLRVVDGRHGGGKCTESSVL